MGLTSLEAYRSVFSMREKISNMNFYFDDDVE